MKKITFKLLALTLCLAMVLTVQPLQAIALPVSEDDAAVGSEAVTEANGKEEAYILKEIEEKREENVKHFLMSDGSYMAAQYDIPVHFRDEEGDWQQYDNSLRENESLQEELINKKSDITVGLSKKAKQNKLVSIVVNGYDISWGFEKANNSPVEYSDTNSDSDSLTELENITEEVWYRNVYKNVDLQYFITPTGIKENIVLKNKNAQNEFTQNYKIGSLKAVQVDSKTIELCDAENNAIYIIKAPLMTDAADNKSDAVSLSIIKNNGNNLTVKITADAEWLGAEERKFPVYVDPWVEKPGEYNFKTDCYLKKSSTGNVTRNVGARHTYVGMTSEGTTRTYMKINLPELNEADVVTRAVFALVPYQNSLMGDGIYKVDAYQITQDWTTATVTFDHPHDTNVLDYCLIDNTDQNYAMWDITRTVKSWYEGGNNYGIMLRGSVESGIVGRRFFNDKNNDEDVRPILNLYYINTVGLNDYNSYKTYDNGAYGTLNLNEYRGTITYTFSDIAYSGNLLNANIYHVYNSEWAGNWTTFGRGWKLNISEKLTHMLGYPNYSVDYPYRLTDEDGTDIYFKSTDTQNVYKDEVGRGWTLSQNGTGDWKFTLEDKNGNKKGYDYHGRLRKIKDIHGNELTITYPSDDFSVPVSSITDSSGRVTSFTYNNGLLSKITDPDGREINYIYDSDGYLVRAERYDGITQEFIMSNSRLHRSSIGESDLVIKYHGDGTCQSLATAPKNSDGNRFLYWEKISQSTRIITHQGPSEDISAQDRLLEYCLFNEQGQKTTSYFKKPNGEFVGEIESSTYIKSNNNVRNNNKIDRTSSTASSVNLLPDGSFEIGGSWSTCYWDSHTDTAAFFGIETNSENAYMGQDCGRITFNAPSQRTVSFFQDIAGLKEGATYTLSGYVKTENLQGELGAFVCATPYYSGGGSTDIYSEYIFGTTDSEVDGGWRRISVTFTVPSNISYVQFHVGIRYSSYGTAWFDCIQLEEGDEVSDYNLVENGGFERSGGWRLTEIESADGISSEQKIFGDKAYKFTGNYSKTKNIYQVIDIYGSKDDVYIFSAWSKAAAAPDVLDDGRVYQIECMISYTDGSVKWTGAIKPSTFITDWQYVSVPVIVKKEDKQPTSITIFIEYYRNLNVGYFDNISLVKDNSQSYVYDENGNVTNAVSAANQSSSFQYSDNEVVKSVASTGHKYYNTYSSSNKHLLIASYADGISYQFNHDSKGNITSATALSSDIVDGGVYVFRSPFENYVLDLYGYQTADGTLLQIYPWNQTSNQKFRLNRVGQSEYYTIRPLCVEEKVLEAPNGATDTATKIKLGTYTGASHQHFKFVPNGKGTYRMVPGHTDAKAVTTWNENGAHIELWANNEHHDRGFVLELLEAGDSTLKMQSSATYTESGQYTNTVTDTLGNTVDYDYDEQKGELISVTDAKGNKTSYINSYGAQSVSTVFADTDKDGVLDDSESFAKYTSSKGLLEKVESNNNTYAFIYDIYGNRTKTKVGDSTLIDYIYNANNGKLNSVVYGNGNTTSYLYDDLNRVSEVNKGSGYIYRYTYDKKGNITSLFDLYRNKTVNYVYDSIGRLISAQVKNGFGMHQTYDAYNRINKLTYTYGADSLTYRYNYNDKNLIGSVTLPTGKALTNNYDGLNRLVSRQIGTAAGLTSSYTYKNGINGTTSALVDTYTTAEGTYSYTYDANGNILTISKDGVLLEAYTYDSLNQLKTVTKGADIYEYTYDNGGNILNVKLNGAVTDTYTYGDENWKDKLTVYNGQTLTYDSIGNPLSYRDGMAMTWQNGRQLYTLDNSAVGITNSYNIDGLRTEKTVLNKTANTTVTYSYEYNGNLLVRQAWNNNIMWFLYDEGGNSVGFTLNGTEYYYIKNLQGDITAIADSTGTILAKYSYDAWGKLLSVTDAYGNDISQDSSHIANINPLRYRGYYYDVETGLYYLVSRYYDPEVKRFINADGQLNVQEGVTGYNLYQYCGNNPINRTDSIGQAWWHWAIGAAVVAACAVATVVTCGGFAAAVSAVAAVGSGVAAATTASTVAAGAFIGSATVYGMAVVTAASTSSSVQEFNDQGNWGTVAAIAGGAVVGGAGAYLGTKGSNATTSTTKPKVTSTIKNDIIDLPRTGHALKTDPYHAFPNIVDNYAGYATKTPINNATLYQLQGSLNGTVGRFEWIVQNQQVTHRMFVAGGGINGIPILK